MQVPGVPPQGSFVALGARRWEVAYTNIDIHIETYILVDPNAHICPGEWKGDVRPMDK